VYIALMYFLNATLLVLLILIIRHLFITNKIR